MLKKITLFAFLFAPLALATPAFAAILPSVSANWAGYVADSGSYTAVGGSWIVPSPSAATRSLSTDATWVGIGGVKSDDLIQAGTQAIIEGGQVAYQAWYELLPDYQQIIPLAIHGGDSVTVSLTQTSAGEWHLSFKDNTTGGDYEKNVAYTSSLSSAEWIEEMPVMLSGRSASYLPLDDFGTVTFSNAYAVSNGAQQSIASSGATSLSMGSRMQALATPSSLLADDSFSVTRTDATTTTSTDSSSFAYGGHVRSSASRSSYRMRGSSQQYVVIVRY